MRLPFIRSQRRLPKISLNPTIAARRRGWWRPWMKWTAYGLGAVLIVVLILTAYYYPKLRPAVAAAKTAKQTAKRLSDRVTQQDFAGAKVQTENLKAQVVIISESLDRAQGLRSWPYLGRQYQAAVDLTKVGSSSVEAVGPLVDFMAH